MCFLAYNVPPSLFSSSFFLPGSVLVTTSRDVRATFAQPQGRICIGAASIGDAHAAALDLNSTSGVAPLMGTNTTVDVVPLLPLLNVTSLGGGSVYAVRVDGRQQSTNVSAHAGGMRFHSGYGIGDSLVLSTETRRHLASVAEDSMGRPDAGLFISFDLGHSLGSPPDGSQLIYASRAAFLLLEPWIFKIVSIGVVSPLSYSIPLRWSVPLACPAGAAAAGVPQGVDDRDLTRMTHALRNEIINAGKHDVSNLSRTDSAGGGGGGGNGTIGEGGQELSAPLRGVVAHKRSTVHSPPFIGLAPQERILHGLDVATGRVVFEVASSFQSPEVVLLVVLSAIISLAGAAVVTRQLAKQLTRFVFGFMLGNARRKGMRRLKAVVTSAAYSDPRFKDQFARQLEKNLASAATAAAEDKDKEEEDDDGLRNNDDGDQSDDDDDAEWSTNPFSIPELLRESWERRRTKSLSAFLSTRTNTLAQPVGKLAMALGNGARTELIALRRFQSLYHAYCFKHRLRPQPLGATNRRVLKDFGISVKHLFDHRTDAFLGIRTCTERERRKRIDVRPFPRESALSFFVRKQCVLSQFESDFVTFRDFARKYAHFTKSAQAANTRPVPVTKREMQRLGVEWRRLHLRFVEARPFQRFPTDVDMSQVALKKMAGGGDTVDRRDGAGALKGGIEDGDRLLPAWFFPDLLVVGVHVAIVTVAVFPLLVLPLIAEAEASSSTAVPPSAATGMYLITMRDLKEWRRPMLIKLQELRLGIITAGFLIAGALAYVLCMFELLVYYTIEPFGIREQMNDGRIPSLPRAILQQCVFGALLGGFGVWCAYFILVSYVLCIQL